MLRQLLFPPVLKRVKFLALCPSWTNFVWLYKSEHIRDPFWEQNTRNQTRIVPRLILREDSPWSESVWLLVRRVENSTSGWRSLWERSPVGPRYYESLFRDVPGTVPESVRACGFKGNSSNLDRASKIRDSVLLKTWDSFLVTLPSVSSEIWVMYSSVTPGTNELCDWLFLVCSCVFLETAANFCLFLNVDISWWIIFDSTEEWIFCGFVVFIQLDEWQKWSFQMSDKLQSFQLTDWKGVYTKNNN